MKYVKLFESWLNTVNEAQLSGPSMDYFRTVEPSPFLDEEASYYKNSKAFEKKIIDSINKLFSEINANNPDDKFTVTGASSGKDVIIKAGSDQFKFKIDGVTYLDGKGANSTLFDVIGETNNLKVTLGQFIGYKYLGEDLQDVNKDPGYAKDAHIKVMDNLVYMATHKGKMPKPTQGPSKKVAKTIKEMTIADYFSLPLNSRDGLIKQVLGPKYRVAPTTDNSIGIKYDIDVYGQKKNYPDLKIAESEYTYLELPQNIEDTIKSASNIDNWPFKNMSQEEYSKMSVANLLVRVYEYPSIQKAEKGSGGSSTSTTLSVFANVARDIAKNNFAFKSGFVTDFRNECELTKDKAKKSSDAWTEDKTLDVAVK